MPGIKRKKATMNDNTDVNNNADAAAKAAADADKAKADAEAAGANTNTDTANATFDPAKISDADFDKVFEDQRLFKHSRFKELTDAQKRLKEIEANKAKDEETKLVEQKKFEELATKKGQEAETLREQLKTERINNSLLAQASKQNVVDPEAVLKLIDRSAITIDDTTGTVTGAEEALKSLIESKPYLAGKQGTQRLGSASNPDNTDTSGLKRFKHSQLQDPVFYRENEKDILASMKAGLIENDLENAA